MQQYSTRLFVRHKGPTLWEIERKNKSNELNIASRQDFQLKTPTSMHEDSIICNPQLSLYCLDDKSKSAVFVETPPEVEISQHSFYYQAQYEHAQRVVTVPYEILNRLAETMDREFHTLVFIYSVGRCGSTLLSRAFAQVNSILSLSEPDVYTQIVAARPSNGTRDAELTRLAQSCTSLLYKSARPGQNVFIIKFRSFSIHIADLLFKAFPFARSVFLYRDAETWARSAARAFDIFNPTILERSAVAVQEEGEMMDRLIPLLPKYIRCRGHAGMDDNDDLDDSFISPRLKAQANRTDPLRRQLPGDLRPAAISQMKILALMWLSVMERYLELDASGVPFSALRYESLVANPDRVLRAIFEYCHVSSEALSVAAAVFSRDSQGGTKLSWERVRQNVSGEVLDYFLPEIREVLREHSRINIPGFVVPHTLSFDS